MLIKKLPHILLTLLIAILVGCGTTNPVAEEAKANFENQNYEAALKTAEKSIEQFPGDPLGYFYKGAALGGIAENIENPEERTEYYKRMNESFELARNVADTAENVPSEIERIDGVKVAHWRTEAKHGYDFATNDSLQKTVEKPMHQSMLHLKNATVIQPDSASTWDLLAQVSSRNKSFEQAISAKKEYLSRISDDQEQAQDYLQLSSYYRSLEQPEEALSILKEGQEQFPDNPDISRHLASIHIATGNPEKAISELERLVEKNPQNAEYRLSMGSELFNLGLTLQDSLATNSQKILDLQDKFGQANESEKKQINDQLMKLSKENEKIISRRDEYLSRAEEEVKTALQYNSEDPSAYETLGVIHRFKAQLVFDQKNRTPRDQNEKAAELDKKGKDLLRNAMSNYEKAVELQPENKEYWKNLFQIYATLGMDEKAQDAMEKAGIN